jgi:tetratricopeptide (TPR) repeat protein
MDIKNMEKNFKIYLLISIFVFLSGCGGGGGGSSGGGSSVNPEKYIEEGWNKYEIKDYTSALNNFNSALSGNPTSLQASKAYTGIGWVYLQLHNYDTAIQNFDLAETKNPYEQDAYVGELVALCTRQKTEDWRKAVEVGTILETLIKSTYQFLYYPYTKYTDVLCLIALSYYYTNNYSEARKRVNTVLDKDPNNNFALLLDELLKIKGY